MISTSLFLVVYISAAGEKWLPGEGAAHLWYLWWRKISQPPDPALQTPGASQGCKRRAIAGWAASGKASERLTGQAGDGSQALLPILCSLPNGGHQLLGLPRWNYASQKTRRPPLSKSVVPGNNVDKYITQRRIRSLSFLLLTHHTITTMYRDCVMVLLRYIQTFGLKSAKLFV